MHPLPTAADQALFTERLVRTVQQRSPAGEPMKIAHVVKAKKIRKGDRMLVLDADGDAKYWEVEDVMDQYVPGWLTVQMVGRQQYWEFRAHQRVVVFR